MSLPFGIEEGLSNNDKQKPGKEQKRKKQPNPMAKAAPKLRHIGQTNPTKINVKFVSYYQISKTAADTETR